MGAYVGFFDCSGAQCEIAVMNVMGRPAAYRLRVFNRAGVRLVDEERALAAHASERLALNDLVAGETGQILIVPVEDEDDEFPALLSVADPGAASGAATRVVALMRIDEVPEDDDEDDDD